MHLLSPSHRGSAKPGDLPGPHPAQAPLAQGRRPPFPPRGSCRLTAGARPSRPKGRLPPHRRSLPLAAGSQPPALRDRRQRGGHRREQPGSVSARPEQGTTGAASPPPPSFLPARLRLRRRGRGGGWSRERGGAEERGGTGERGGPDRSPSPTPPPRGRGRGLLSFAP